MPGRLFSSLITFKLHSRYRQQIQSGINTSGTQQIALTNKNKSMFDL